MKTNLIWMAVATLGGIACTTQHPPEPQAQKQTPLPEAKAELVAEPKAATAAIPKLVPEVALTLAPGVVRPNSAVTAPCKPKANASLRLFL